MKHPAKAYVVATSSGFFDATISEDLKQVLRSARLQLGMDVVFVSRFTALERVFDFVDTSRKDFNLQSGMSDPIEQSWCNLIAQGKAPEVISDAGPLIASGLLPATPLQIGTHLSVPVQLADGRIYGTLCCFSADTKGAALADEVSLLKRIAKMLAEQIDASSP